MSDLPSLANDKYSAKLRSGWVASPADATILVDAIPANFPTILVVGWNTIYETVFRVESSSGDNSSNYALTGVTRIKGANTNLPEGTAVNCLNNEEYFNQWGDIVAVAQADASAAKAVTDALPPNVIGQTGVATMTNKRITKRVASQTSTGTITPDSNNYEVFDITALAVTGAFQVPAGTPTDSQGLVVRIMDNAHPHPLTWATATGGYEAGGSSLPSTTVSGKYLHLGFMYVTSNSLNKWMLIASQQEQ
jgi:hypothetical protein